MRSNRSAVLVRIIAAVFAVSLVFGVSPVSAKMAHGKSSAGPPVNTYTKSGTVIFSDYQFPDSLNPLETSIGVSAETFNTMLDSLLVFNGKGTLVPDLLENVPSLANHEILNHGRTIILKLKPGDYWSSGKLITSKDILFGWEVDMQPATGPYCKGTCDHIKSITLKGKYEAILHLKDNYVPILAQGMPQVWPHEWTRLGTTPAAAAHNLAQNPAFNFEDSSYWTDGPYQVQSFVNNDRIVLTPMKYYHVHPGPHVAKLIFVTYTDKNALLAAAISGATDVTTDYTLADVPVLQSHSNVFKTYVTGSFLIENLQVNQFSKTYKGRPNPLVKTKVRQALALALDKIGILRSALGITAAVAKNYVAYTPWVVTKRFVQEYSDTSIKGAWDPLLHKYVGYGNRSLADAKKLMKQAGYPHGFPLDFITTAGNSVRAGEYAVIAANWAKLGVTTSLTTLPANDLFADWDAGGPIAHENFQIGMWSIGTAPDPDSMHEMFTSQYLDALQKTHSVNNQDWSGVQDKVIDSDMNKAAVSFNPKVRAKLYKQVQQHLEQNADWIQIYYRPQVVTASHHVTGVTGTVFFGNNTLNCYDWKAK